MHKGRLEAFSDGVIAILITIMVLELKLPPHDSAHAVPSLADLKPLLPIFLSYILSFLYIGIYWNNHHHLLQASQHVTGGVLWANLHLLFWLSLLPFVTEWMGENHFAAAPAALYGIILLLCAIAYELLQRRLVAANPKDSPLAKAVRHNAKGNLSIILYAAAIPLSFVSPWISCSIYAGVALVWLIPDRRIENTLATPK